MNLVHTLNQPLSYNFNNFIVEKSKDTFEKINRFNQKMKVRFAYYLIYFVSSLISLLFIVFIRLLIVMMKRELKKIQNSDWHSELSIEDYLKLKTILKKSTVNKENAEFFSYESVSQLPVFFRFYSSEITKLLCVIKDYKNEINNILSTYNREKFNNSSELFTFKPESELFEQRPSAYKYWA